MYRNTARSESGCVTAVLSCANAHVSFGLTATILPRAMLSMSKCFSPSTMARSKAVFCVMATLVMMIFLRSRDQQTKHLEIGEYYHDPAFGRRIATSS